MDQLRLLGGIVDLRAMRFEPTSGEGSALSGREVELLRYLAERVGETVDRETLYAEVWGYGAGVVSRALDASVRRLRNKIERDPSNPDHLLTIHGEGYRFEAAGIETAPPVATATTWAAVGLDPAAPFDPGFAEAAARALAAAGGEVVVREGDEIVARFSNPARAVVWCLSLVAEHDAARGAACRGDAHARVQRLLASCEGGRVQLTEALFADVESATVVRDQAWRSLGPVRLTRTEDPEPLVEAGGSVPDDASAPPPMGALVGRRADLARLLSAIQAERLVTLTGTGGVGKTRLAREAVERWTHDACFADLSGCHTEPEVALAVARALRMPVGRHADPSRTLAALPDHLVVLDNAEQALHPVRTLCERWSGAHLLVTSRERLGAPSEIVVPLEPLLPEDAVALFEARVCALGFDPGEPDAVRALVTRLDGLPLAIELAAERAGVVGPQDVGSLGSELDSVVAWSWGLLDEGDQGLLVACAAFVATFTAEDAVEVSGHSDISGLVRLRRKGLVRLDPDRRLSLYVAVRDWVREHAAEAVAAARDRHAQWFARRGVQTVPDVLSRAGADAVVARLALELPELLAAVEHGLEHEPRMAVGAFLGAAPVLRSRGPTDGIEAMALAVLPHASPEEQVRIHVARMVLGAVPGLLDQIERALSALDVASALGPRVEVALQLADYDKARALLTASRAAVGDDEIGQLQATQQEAYLCEQFGQWERAADLLGQALVIHRRRGAIRGELGMRRRLAVAAMHLGKLDEALRQALHARGLAETLADPRPRGAVGYLLGQLHMLRGEVNDALAEMAAARPPLLRAGDVASALGLSINIGWGLSMFRSTADARRVVADALLDARAGGFEEDDAILTGNLGSLDLAEGRLDDAVRRLEDAVARHVEASRHHLVATHGALLGKTRWLQGDASAARVELDRALEAAEAGQDGRVRSGVALQRAVLFAAAGDGAAAETELEHASENLATGSVPDRVALAAARAEVAIQLASDDAEAELRSFRRALERHDVGAESIPGRDLARLDDLISPA